MKKVLITLISTLTLSTAWAVQCPTVASIQAVGLSHAEVEKDGTWVATNDPGNKYGTEYDWIFIMGPAEENGVKIYNESEVLPKANAALKTLGSPVSDGKDYPYAGCMYPVTPGYMAVALAQTGPWHFKRLGR